MSAEYLTLKGKETAVRILDKLSLEVVSPDGAPILTTSPTLVPTLKVRSSGSKPSSPEKLETIQLYRAGDRKVSAFDDGVHRGKRILLCAFGGVDVQLELVVALAPQTDELLIQVEQIGGRDIVQEVHHLYRIEKPTASGGYMVLPHGSGYLIPAECGSELPGQGYDGGLIGDRWTLPMFGMTSGRYGTCVMVETWWDCDVKAEHVPGEISVLDFNWLGSLGKLAYPRRILLQFARGMDYLAMAKIYRERAKKEGLVRTLEQKAAQTPVIHRYLDNVLFRLPAWNPDDGQAVLDDISKLGDMGFGVNFFFPKWSGDGNLWQTFLHPNPVPGGWQALRDYAESARKLGCTIQGFILPGTQVPDEPGYDNNRWPCDANGQQIRGHDPNQPDYSLSTHDALERTILVLDNLQMRQLRFDVLYFDGYSAYGTVPEDFSADHLVTRRQIFKDQNACFAETRRRGIMPGAEVARFWCIGDCDYFFFSDWSSDRLSNAPVTGAPAPVGHPIPLFQLVFHDCYMAGFSSGGYALYAPGFDWWADHTPRLYELLFASAPAYNWLPDGYVPVRDWDSPRARNRWQWLKRWSAYYRAVATSQMISHRFVSGDYGLQQIEFANGVSAQLNMAENLCRVEGVESFTGQWEHPAGDLGQYPTE